MAKVTIQRQPAGYLFTQDGHEYFLMRPEPTAKDSWQLDNQQRWSVIRRVSVTAYDKERDDYTVESFPEGDTITIITTNPTIELCELDPISVEVELISEEDFINSKLPDVDLDEEDRQQLRFDMDKVFPNPN